MLQNPRIFSYMGGPRIETLAHGSFMKNPPVYQARVWQLEYNQLILF